MLAAPRLRPVRDDHVRVPQLMTVRAALGRDLGDAAVGIRPELHHELLEHAVYYAR